MKIDCKGCEFFNEDFCEHKDGIGFIGREFCFKFPDVNLQQQKIDELEDLYGTAMLELKSSIQSKIDAQRKFESLEKLLTDANNKICSMRFFSHSHFLYKFEQDFVEKRTNIANITFSGGFGYVTCVVITKDEFDVEKEYYISDDFMASTLLDYWEVKTSKEVQ